MNRVLISCIFIFLISDICIGDPEPIKYWRSSFETGFPGEWLNYDNGSWTEDGTPNPDKNEAWTIIDGNDVPDGAIHGSKVYKGWVLEAQSESHRAYPCIHCDYASPLVNSWWVYLDTDYSNFPSGGWHHFATWGNNPDWDVHTMSVLGNGKLEMAHVSDFEVIGDNAMPLREWVRFTVYIEYEPAGSNLIYCWMNDLPCMKATNIKPGGSNLQRAHWGLYTSGNLFEGIQYNDDIQIWGLTEPWTDFTKVPTSPYDSTPVILNTKTTKGKLIKIIANSPERICFEVKVNKQKDLPVLHLYTVMGRHITKCKPLKFKTNSVMYSLEKRVFPAGVYYLIMQNEDIIFSKKIKFLIFKH